MDWLRTVGGEGLFGTPSYWLPFAGLWALLFVLAGAELARPLHLSPRESPGRLLANFGLGIINALILSALPLSSVLAAEWARTEEFGAFHLLSIPAAPAAIATVLIWGLAIYGLHRLAHRVPLLWRMHRVHHSDTAVDLSTGVRHHPLEMTYVTAVLSALAVLLGLSAAAIAIYAIVAGAFALWTHANVRLPEGLDGALRLIVMTPAAHHVHHSADQRETDSNYADVFLFWDRLFGTYRFLSHSDLVRMRAGLGESHDKGAGNILTLIRLPFSGPATNHPDRSET